MYYEVESDWYLNIFDCGSFGYLRNVYFFICSEEVCVIVVLVESFDK